ncbi:hypothetical protein N9360_00790 [Candidatus Marinimicrobia bacterium]|nr:hypothetical protein [Candidatus Neomarinimicrobiota bacterium]MDB3887600.1 hypothetical protein [Candidatus Neomarinimicrobiota bacterium]|tara:strand:+ start:453 stop:1004 length:552 start_codon:yes stop_codon:yes gene_type:complete
MKSFKKISFIIIFLTLHCVVFTQSKKYDIYLYDTLKGMTLSVDNSSFAINALSFGKLLLEEDLEYKEQSFEVENSLINRILLQPKINIVDAQWEDSVKLLDGQVAEIRFLYAKEDTLGINNDKKAYLLYRLDIKSEDKEISKNENIVNKALIKSSIIKIWVDKKTKSMVKFSLMYNGVLYTIK